ALSCSSGRVRPPRSDRLVPVWSLSAGWSRAVFWSLTTWSVPAGRVATAGVSAAGGGVGTPAGAAERGKIRRRSGRRGVVASLVVTSLATWVVTPMTGEAVTPVVAPLVVISVTGRPVTAAARARTIARASGAGPDRTVSDHS